MTPIQTFLKQHPVRAFYILVFVISWGGILMLAGPGGMPGTEEQVERLMPLMLLALFAGPSVASLILTALISGRRGLHELGLRLLRWRVAAKWYAIALLFAPLLVTAILLTLSLFSLDYIPGIVTTSDKISLLLFGIAWGLIGGGFLEELGWTGFAIPRLRLRYDAFTTALIVGLLWGIWHFLIAFWTSGSVSGEDSRNIFVAGFLIFYVGALPAYRVLMVWVYDRTGSLLLAMLMHASLSASTLILQPVATGFPYLTWNFALAAVLWIVVAAVAIASRKKVLRPPLQRQPA